MKHWLEMVIILLQSDTSDLRELCRIAGGDPSTFYRGVNLDHLDLSEADREFFQQGAVSDAITRIKGAARQEERIAILLDQILQNRDVGISALFRYSRKRPSSPKGSGVHSPKVQSQRVKDASNDQLIAKSLVQQLYKEVFPDNCGVLLYFLADLLGKYPAVNAAIRECMNRTALDVCR